MDKSQVELYKKLKEELEQRANQVINKWMYIRSEYGVGIYNGTVTFIEIEDGQLKYNNDWWVGDRSNMTSYTLPESFLYDDMWEESIHQNAQDLIKQRQDEAIKKKTDKIEAEKRQYAELKAKYGNDGDVDHG